MAYTQLEWVAGGAPAINSSNLNHLETQYTEMISYTTTFLLLSGAGNCGAPVVPAVSLGTNSTAIATCKFVEDTLQDVL